MLFKAKKLTLVNVINKPLTLLVLPFSHECLFPAPGSHPGHTVLHLAVTLILSHQRFCKQPLGLSTFDSTGQDALQAVLHWGLSEVFHD